MKVRFDWCGIAVVIVLMSATLVGRLLFDSGKEFEILLVVLFINQ